MVKDDQEPDELDQPEDPRVRREDLSTGLILLTIVDDCRVSVEVRGDELLERWWSRGRRRIDGGGSSSGHVHNQEDPKPVSLESMTSGPLEAGCAGKWSRWK